MSPSHPGEGGVLHDMSELGLYRVIWSLGDRWCFILHINVIFREFFRATSRVACQSVAKSIPTPRMSLLSRNGISSSTLNFPTAYPFPPQYVNIIKDSVLSLSPGHHIVQLSVDGGYHVKRDQEIIRTIFSLCTVCMSASNIYHSNRCFTVWTPGLTLVELRSVLDSWLRCVCAPLVTKRLIYVK